MGPNSILLNFEQTLLGLKPLSVIKRFRTADLHCHSRGTSVSLPEDALTQGP